MLKKIGMFIVCAMLFISMGTILSAKNIHRMKMEKVEKILLRGMANIGPKQQVKIDNIFEDYTKEVVKVMGSKLKDSKKLNKILSLRKKRDKKMKKVLNRNQWKVYEENKKILEEEYKKSGVDHKKGIEMLILE